MKVGALIIILFYPLIYSCSARDKINPGWWRIDRVEILKNDQLTRVIDSENQYWNFRARDSIEIFEGHQLQVCLQVRMDKHSIRSIDRKSGGLIDEYFISKSNKDQLELYSTIRMEEDNYRVVYYLDKVEDTLSTDTKQSY
jgi:hypothetical protein